MNIWDFWAKRYDKLWVQKHSLGPTRRYIINILDLDRSIKILDLGSGPGELMGEILQLDPNVDITGLDLSEEMLKESKKKNPSANHIHMDVSDLHSLNKSYDLIISSHSLPYWKNPNKVMKDLYNILKPNGKIIIGFASGETLYDRLILFFVKFTTGLARYPSDSDFRSLLGKRFEVKEMKIIRERKYMPRIAIYTLEKVN